MVRARDGAVLVGAEVMVHDIEVARGRVWGGHQVVHPLHDGSIHEAVTIDTSDSIYGHRVVGASICTTVEKLHRLKVK